MHITLPEGVPLAAAGEPSVMRSVQGAKISESVFQSVGDKTE